MSASLTAARPAPAATAQLFSPYWLGRLRLPNRIVMAPLTRARADEHGVPSGIAAEYYSQRAGAGLIIAEATAVSRQGTGYDHWPGLHTAAQQVGWRTITEAVHAAGGRIFVQLFHAGRMSHPVLSGFFRPLFPGAIIAAGGHTAATGSVRIGQNQADLIAYGQLFIANPDLPARFRLDAPLAQPQRATFYGGGAAGYTDYPPLSPTGSQHPSQESPVSEQPLALAR
jgi:2,4-dienoyl-CoA reductase-like NADH-dependent reductase (Old Yellow Enzyme family)